MILILMFLWTRIFSFGLELQVWTLPQIFGKASLCPKEPFWILIVFFFWKIISKYMLTCTRSLAWPLVSTVENLCTCPIRIFYSFCRWQHPISTTKGKSQVPIMCTLLVTQSTWNCSMNFMSPKQKTIGLMTECTLHT